MLYAILVDEALAPENVSLTIELVVIFALALVLVVDFVLDQEMIVLLLFAGCFVEVELFVDVAVCVVIVLELLSSVSSFEVVVSVSVVLSVKSIEGKVKGVVVC